MNGTEHHAMEMPASNPSAQPIGVLLVDDEDYVLWGLAQLIDGERPRMLVTGVARSIPEALDVIGKCDPSVVVLDVFLGGESSLEHLPQLRAAGGVPVVVLTGADDDRIHRTALERGAWGVVLKDQPAEVLLRSIERAGAEKQGGAA
jgi:DNA-binding NarL/FixJ family response regulator